MKLILIFLFGMSIYGQDWEDLRNVRHNRVLENEYQRLGVDLNQNKANMDMVMIFVILIFISGIVFAFWDSSRNHKEAVRATMQEIGHNDYITRSEFKQLLLAINERKQELIK